MKTPEAVLRELANHPTGLVEYVGRLQQQLGQTQRALEEKARQLAQTQQELTLKAQSLAQTQEALALKAQ